MPNGQCIIVGAGSIGLQLIRLLSRELDLVCIDLDQERLEAAKEIREDLEAVRGDATSRLVLEEVRVDEAEMVVITTTSEKVNLEVARVLRDHFTPRRVLAVGITQRGIETLEELGVEVVGIFSLAAIGLRNRLEHKTKAVQGIGLGKNEILEVEVHPHSRLANKPLMSLNPKSWRVGIIYREGNIIIPRGETVMRPKDRLILLGDPKVLKTVTDLLTFRFTHFPREYGDTLTACFNGRETEAYLEEIGYLMSVFPLEKALFVFTREHPQVEERLRREAEKHHLKEVEVVVESAGAPLEALQQALQERVRRSALVVLSRQDVLPSAIPFFGSWRAKKQLREISRLVGCPMMLAAGTCPYEKVAVPCVEKEGLQHAMETTLEMSSSISYAIEALLVNYSPYIATAEESRDFEEMRKTISDLGLIYKTSIRVEELEGNPVRAVTEAIGSRNLMVMDLGSWRRSDPLTSLVRPDIAWEIVRRAPVSTLLIPPMEMIA